MTRDELVQKINGLDADAIANLIISLKDEISRKDKIISDKDLLIAELREMRRMRAAEQYKPSSEALAVQLQFLFPEFEILSAVIEDEQPEEKKTGKGVRKPRTHRKETTLPAASDVCDIYHDQDAPESFSRDGIEYVRGEDYIQNKISYIPAKVIVERHHYPAYVTRDAEAAEGENRIILMNAPEVEGLSCSPSLLANIVTSKFDDHLPLYRQEEAFARNGIILSRQKMASWVIKYAQMLAPLDRLLLYEVFRSGFMNMDETPAEVLDFRTATKKISQSGFMHVIIGSTYCDKERTTHVLVYFKYIQGRSRDIVLEDYRKSGYSGYVMTDGLKSYLPIAKHCVCWIHGARGFKKILKIDSQEENAAKMCMLIAGLYKVEDKWRGKLLDGEIDREAFLAGRKGESMLIIDRIYSFADELKPKYSEKGAMGKALNYLYTYKASLTTYLDCVEATPDNNISERSCRTVAVGRKNWLFCKSIDGADASALLYSLVETAKASGLNPETYLEYVFTMAPGCKCEEDWRKLLPWNVDLSSLDEARTARFNAEPDRSRTTDYHFTGLTSQTVTQL